VPIDGRNQVEVGYGLMSEFWGQGLATELARESLRIAYTVIHLPEVVSFTLPTNLASRRVMEKIGLHYDKDTVYADLPHVLYRQTVEQWKQQQSANDINL
jgi:RimJ/RimL family protein N-acetyltransferase